MPTAVFGYGSVVWKFPYPHSKQWAPVCVRGYERVFYQGSTDHRGTPEAPGRTVTLVPQEGGVVWGACFLIDGPEEAAVLAEMEVREKQYDVRERLAVYDASGQCVVESALCYIGTPECDNWLGPPEGGVDELAQQIAVAVGPSGPNDEYLFNLAHAMREYGVQDDSLFELERKVKEVQAALRDTAGAAS
uniref:glutathione-specific gamma-glutamylcyclotransferase n=1 Tax=Prasinoderma coloniale TaxID=156133 RepID=A0A7R9TV92_9VIRI